MICLSYTSILLLIIFSVLATLLVVWLIYRNMKDEDEFENEMDDTSQQSVDHKNNNEEKI